MHDRPFGAYYGDIEKRGYTEEEYFIAGVATAYSAADALTSDGIWNVIPHDTAPYKTRLLVRRPTDPSRFNGTVVIEWLNVSFGFDTSFSDAPALFDDGYVYVGVSAQRIGVNGDSQNPQGLSHWDSVRYGDLLISNDAYSYDIFTQAARALGKKGNRKGIDPLNGLDVKQLIAVGVSQSGGRMLTYANAIQPLTGTFDAIMPIVCAGAAAPLNDALGAGGILFTQVRNDLNTPVFCMNTESEALYYYKFRQPDTDMFRYWEIAGSSHGPRKQVEAILARTRRDGVSGPWDNWTQMSNVCWLPTLDAAIHHVRGWAKGDEPPPCQEPFAIEKANNKLKYARDKFGNVIGGVRLPEVEVPIASYAGQAGLRGLAGTTTPLPQKTLETLYPTHEDYVAKVETASNAALESGVILPYRAREYLEDAKSAQVPT